MQFHPAHSPTEVARLDSASLREAFLWSGLFVPGQGRLHHWETDRTVAGGFCPGAEGLVLGAVPELRTAALFARREGGLVNVGGPGCVRVDGVKHRLGRRDALYVGRGAQAVTLHSDDPAAPARFWLLSYPAHRDYPTRLVPFAAVPGEPLGARETANQRRLHKLIHPGAFPTCQLMLGITCLEPGCVWNTMPPHTHARRSEVYLYFDLPADAAILHLLGQPDETRHLVVRDGEAVLSPPWSVHAGAGTTAYSFVWGMGGENQEFPDMDPVPLATLR